MRHIRDYVQKAFHFGDRGYTLVSFEEDIDFGLLSAVIFALDKKTYFAVRCADVDFDKYTIGVDPESYEHTLPKSYYMGKKVRSQSGR